MNKLKLTLKEEDIITDDIIDGVSEEPTEEEINNEIFTEPADTSIDFIASDELNEIREILLDIPDDIRLLLLDDKLIILSSEGEDDKTQVYCLTEDEDFFTVKELSTNIEDILNDETIIKYTPDGPDSRHEHIVDLLMKKLEEPDEENIPEEPEEDIPEEEDDNE